MIFICINILPYNLSFQSGGTLIPLLFVVSVAGTMLMLYLSKLLENICALKYFLYYAGNHTLVILALHLLAFNLIDLVIIAIEDLPIDHLAQFPVISSARSWWLVYAFVGVLVPLGIIRCYEIIRNKIINRQVDELQREAV